MTRATSIGKTMPAGIRQAFRARGMFREVHVFGANDSRLDADNNAMANVRDRILNLDVAHHTKPPAESRRFKRN